MVTTKNNELVSKCLKIRANNSKKEKKNNKNNNSDDSNDNGNNDSNDDNDVQDSVAPELTPPGVTFVFACKYGLMFESLCGTHAGSIQVQRGLCAGRGNTGN